MFYDNIHIFDILVFAGIAAFLFYRLRRTLGKKTGFEKKADVSKIKEMVEKYQGEENSPPTVRPSLDSNISELEKVYDRIENFNHTEFLAGAKNAFEIIIGCFNEGNKRELKPLLTKNTHKVFCDAIDSNKNARNSKILSLEIESVNKVWDDGKKIFVTLTFSSKQIDENGKSQAQKKDKWTFEKLISNKDPNWLLLST